MGCPLSVASAKRDFKKNGKLLRLWIKNGMIWWNTHPDAESHTKFESIYDLFYHNLFCRSYQDYLIKKYNRFETLDTKAKMEQYFGVDLTV